MPPHLCKTGGVANILCFDFDDTVVMENTARLVFERFAAPEWREREDDYKAGRLEAELKKLQEAEKARQEADLSEVEKL